MDGSFKGGWRERVLIWVEVIGWSFSFPFFLREFEEGKGRKKGEGYVSKLVSSQQLVNGEPFLPLSALSCPALLLLDWIGGMYFLG